MNIGGVSTYYIGCIFLFFFHFFEGRSEHRFEFENSIHYYPKNPNLKKMMGPLKFDSKFGSTDFISDDPYT